MMTRDVLLIIVLFMAAWYFVYKLVYKRSLSFQYSLNNRLFKPKNFKQIVQSAYPNYVVLNRSRSIMICEMNQRSDPEELVIITIQPNSIKSLKIQARILLATYPYQPSVYEMKKDFSPYLK